MRKNMVCERYKHNLLLRVFFFMQMRNFASTDVRQSFRTWLTLSPRTNPIVFMKATKNFPRTREIPLSPPCPLSFVTCFYSSRSTPLQNPKPLSPPLANFLSVQNFHKEIYKKRTYQRVLQEMLTLALSLSQSSRTPSHPSLPRTNKLPCNEKQTCKKMEEQVVELNWSGGGTPTTHHHHHPKSRSLRF